MPLTLITILILLLPITADAQSSTWCWRLGAEIKCETTTQSSPSLAPGTPGYQGWQPPKVTTCWRQGAELRCEER
jgi:hypothetical protein